MKNFTLILLTLFVIQSALSQNDVAIYWDASYSMKDRDIQKEFNYLNNYFKKYKDANVQLITFSNDIILEEKFSIKDSNWQDLRAELQNTLYDGATSYSNLFTHTANVYMLFTDGNENLDRLDPPIDRPINIISTEINRNAPRFNRIADASNGSFVVISNDINTPLTQGKAVIFDPNDDGLITGVVTNNGLDALANVNIINKRTNKSATTRSDGSYSIEADSGDILVFSYLGKKSVNIKVVNEQMNIKMIDLNQQLDEVVVEAQVEKEEMVNVGNKVVDKKRLGYSVETVTDEVVSQIDTDIKQVVKGQFAGLQVANNTAIDRVDLSQFIGRGRNGSIEFTHYGLIVIDGVPQQQSDSRSGFTSTIGSSINPDNIASITYLKGLAATNKYGTLGKNGVLLITTKGSVLDRSTEKKEIPLGTTDTYSDKAELVASLPNTSYIKALKATQSVDDAFKEYLVQREKHDTKAEFFMDCYDYFKGWNNPYLSDRILSNVYENFFDNPNVLRALAYKQIENKDFDKALLTSKRILKLEPNKAQSYRDLAYAQTLAGNYQEALKIYDRVDKLRNVGTADFSGLQKTITNDFKNLINHHKSKLNTAGVNPKYLKPVKHKARIVFEWNSPEIEFDLQIVNPQKRFFTWEHTRSKAAERIAEEKQQGFGLEEFYITSSDVGEWLFNIKYFGTNDRASIPSYLKVTIYNDFGLPNETIETKVIRLTETGKLQTAVKLSI